MEWQTTPTFSEQAPQKVRNSYKPRLKPHNLFARVDNKIHEMEPTEYLIGYSNGLVSVGMVKHQSDIKDKPLTMRFGNWEHFDGKKLYVGCVVLVKSYARMINSTTGALTDFVGKDATARSLFYASCLSANTQATEWCMINKPTIEPALGMVHDFWTNTERDGSVRFTGMVYDQENEVEEFVADDIWPTYITNIVVVKQPVVINWIRIEEPYSVYFGQNHLNFLVPTYAKSYLDAKDYTSTYWLGWVDTQFSKSCI